MTRMTTQFEEEVRNHQKAAARLVCAMAMKDLEKLYHQMKKFDLEADYESRLTLCINPDLSFATMTVSYYSGERDNIKVFLTKGKNENRYDVYSDEEETEEKPLPPDGTWVSEDDLAES